MGQKAKNAGKKKQMPPKAKVSTLPKTAIKISDTLEAEYAFRELMSISNTTLEGKKCSHTHKNYNVKNKNGSVIRIPID